MKLTRLRIHQLPGIDRGFTLAKLGPGINLVTGPNAIGKSSLIRALRYLIAQPETADPAALALAADFRNGGEWTVRRTGRGYEWQCNGAVAERPPLPERDGLHTYWLTMENLVQAGESDRLLMQQLTRALDGGYDLPALRKGEFEPRPRLGQSEGSRLNEALGEQRRAASAQHQLRQREAALPELEARIERARQAGVRAGQLDGALALHDVVTEREEIQAALAAFPAHMEKLHGNELERLGQLENDQADLQRQIKEAGRSRQDAEQALEASGLAAARPQAQELQAQRKALDDLAHRRLQLNDEHKTRDQALAAEKQALQALGGHEEPPRLTPESIARAEALAADLKNKQTERDETKARLRYATEPPKENDLTRHRLAVQALQDWLGAERTRASNKPANLIAAAAGAIAGIAAGFAHAWIALAAAVIAVLASLWCLLPGKNTAGADARRNFARQNLDGPAEWSRSAVGKTLENLQQAFDGLRVQQRQALEYGNDRARLLQQQKELEEKEEQKQRLAETIGFDPGLSAQGVDHFVRRVDDYQRAAQQRQALDDTIERMEAEITASLDSIRRFLSRWHVNIEADYDALNAAVNELAGRTCRAEEAAATMASLDTGLARLRGDSGKHTKQIAGLYREAGLAPGERTALETGVEKLEAWKNQREHLRDNEVRASQHRQALADQPEWLHLAENGERDTLEREREKARAEAGELESLRDQRAQLQADIKSAGDNRQLERAGAAVDTARAALEERLDEQLFAEAGGFLLDQVESEHRSEHRPEVLREAGERFQRFTHHAWDVDLIDGRFKARDLRQNTLRELTELSSGTRMQLLLAVRLAWTRRLEQTLEPLPLFLDEALTTADEDRFAAVAQSLESLAREEGRQVFYLSARRHELGLWEKVTGHQPHHIDLAAIRDRQAAANPTSFDVAPEQPMPSPEGKQPAQYAAELGVPPSDPRQPATELHLFYLLRDDLPLLHRLMQHWHINTVGQLQALLRSGAAGKAIPDSGAREKLAWRCSAADAWMDAWRIGRGKPVDRIALEASGAVSDKFIGKVTTLAEENNGDAAAILEALENKAAPGFRANKIEELNDFFQHNGHIVPSQPLDRDERARQTLFSAAGKAPPDEIRQLTLWLEAAAGHEAPVEAAVEQKTLSG